jgi:hypothetical protein
MANSATFPGFQLPNILRTQTTGWENLATQPLSSIYPFVPDYQALANENNGLRSVFPTSVFEAQMARNFMMMTQPALPSAAVQAAVPYSNRVSFARYT